MVRQVTSDILRYGVGEITICLIDIAKNENADEECCGTSSEMDREVPPFERSPLRPHQMFGKPTQSGPSWRGEVGGLGGWAADGG